jgi:FdhD protein
MERASPASARPAPDGADPAIARKPVLRYAGPGNEAAEDDLPVEAPLQVRLAGEDVAVTMRTPGHDDELAVGFLYSEGIIGGKAHIEEISYCLGEDGRPAPNVINVFPTDRELVDPRQWRRDFFASSSCGLCGKTSIDSVTRSLPPAASSASVTAQTLYELGDKLQQAQEGFARSGGLHAAGLFDLEGNLLLLREDIGRHNAVDKIIGNALLHDLLPLDRHILLVSSRASFEIVQKAHAAGIVIMAVISAPSSLAVELAERANMTLIAFLRERRLNVYAGRERISNAASED